LLITPEQVVRKAFRNGNPEAGAQHALRQVECLRMVKACMNHADVLGAITESDDFVCGVALNLDSLNLDVCALTLEILTVIALHSSKGHFRVVEALESFRSSKGEPLRFYSLVEILRSESPQLTLAFKVLVLIFINTLINAASSIEVC
jgi:hypothetical protein